MGSSSGREPEFSSASRNPLENILWKYSTRLQRRVLWTRNCCLVGPMKRSTIWRPNVLGGVRRCVRKDWDDLRDEAMRLLDAFLSHFSHLVYSLLIQKLLFCALGGKARRSSL